VAPLEQAEQVAILYLALLPLLAAAVGLDAKEQEAPLVPVETAALVVAQGVLVALPGLAILLR